MCPISRTVLGALAAAGPAVTVIAPSGVRPQEDVAGKRPLTGSEAAGEKGDRTVTVTLVTGDEVLVSRDGPGPPTAPTR
ncbi:hypothetical protein [Streptomyces sp. Wb2n-11]|uniref:hypothetical protein n=1 Tax=Streptomyces sp. Wb2n-11 TaxID=1030533 RepID=UPI000A63A9DE|nr:hypothetical protein [Streptomyces sp. Wb2n-11]